MTKLEAMQAVWKDVQACTACEIAKTASRRVFGDGDVSARIVVVGEGPGEEENLSGHPFVGNAGKLLTDILNRAGLKREELFICNSVKCWANRNGKNRQPAQAEIDNCATYLGRQISIIQPAVIVAMGNVAAAALTGDKVAKIHITDLVGYTAKWDLDTWLIYTFHPSYLLHRGLDPVLVDRVVDHFFKAKEVLNDRKDSPRPDSTGERDGAAGHPGGTTPRRRYRRVF